MKRLRWFSGLLVVAWACQATAWGQVATVPELQGPALLAEAKPAGQGLFALAQVEQPAVEREEVEVADVDDFGPRGGDWEFIFTGTGQNDNDFDEVNFTFSGSIGYFFDRHWEIFLRQNLTFFDNDESGTFGSTRVGVDYHFDFDRFQPFVGANIGGQYGDEVTDSGLIGIEGGVKWFVLRQTFLFGAVEYQWLWEDSDDIDDRFDDGVFLYTFGIGFLFH